jgi:hypothetical protein
MIRYRCIRKASLFFGHVALLFDLRLPGGVIPGTIKRKVVLEMPRKRMVTRTVKVTRVTANVANIKEQTFGTAEIVVPKVFKSQEKLEKKAQEICGADVKILSVTSVEPDLIRYGMPEEVFVKNAEVLPGKANENENEESEESEEE